ncbi:FMN-dependent NADH-azoreductase [Paraglaciecola arctica]|uniref:FMN dependent NADH:quinone oxidoreductase n=1 Tax=Paraglaciecola arctica BSs20135 TaxID=493475 RepID=K6YZI3_9ALTE|nr:NAD(P)H-dependent oxidoreductase [Paraglaciecola arctica]GAC22168.1 FMN-dependent NADH-azoreductase 2 [Paraglaciecola arctica BSs20135]
MSILHIDTSARLTGSNTRIIGQYLVNELNAGVVHRDLAVNPLPPISAQDLMGVHGSSDDQRDSLHSHLALSDQLIQELKDADTLVIGAAMYNFGIPASLKQWIDAICRAGVSFKYTEQGPVGLLNIKRAFIITATGGTPVGSDMDFASDYLAHICNFIGVKEVVHIDAGGSKGSPEQIIESGKLQIDSFLENEQTNEDLAVA